MKRLNHLYAIIFTMITIVGTLSCSDDTDMPLPSPAAAAGLPVALSLQSKAEGSTPSLDYSIYVFSRNQATTENYTLDTLISPIREDSKLKFSNNDLNQKEYRFLFTATPKGTSETTITTSTNQTPPALGTSWGNIRLISGNTPLSIHNYYQVKDLKGEDIIATDTIRGELTRTVGQMTFQFSKIGNGINDIQPINDPTVTSIFDRIHRIEIEYNNYTTALSFNETGQLQPADKATVFQTQPIATGIDPQFRVSLPYHPLDLIDNDIRNGGRIEGLCLLPNSGNIQVSLIFFYYDTTPICGKTETHTTDCYNQRNLRLNLPQSVVSGLPIIENTYTVNKTGIHCNRIIDIETTHGLKIDTEWRIN